MGLWLRLLIALVAMCSQVGLLWLRFLIAMCSDIGCYVVIFMYGQKLALKESNISRYKEEFHEVCIIGKGSFGTVYKCINRLGNDM